MKITLTGGSGSLGSEFSFAFLEWGGILVILDQNEKSLGILEKSLLKINSYKRFV
jgi:FlaA1/EpsC-like NDP-sugar epimerase